MAVTERIKTLVIYGNGAGWIPVACDTFFRGILRIKYNYTESPRFKKFLLINKIFRQLRQRYEALSYAVDWQEALLEAPELDVELCNINNLIEYHSKKKAIEQYPLVIVLHSAAGDSMSLLIKTLHWFQRRKGKLVVFIGNEYDLMNEKTQFIKSVEADYVCSQLPAEAANWLYSDSLSPNSKLLLMPHALNPKIYRPIKEIKREIDVGFIGARYPAFIGDRERNNLIECFEKLCERWEFLCDIRIGNIPRKKWALFLCKCKGIIGAEAGTYFLDKEGKLVSNAKRYIKKHPNATFDEVYDHCFKNVEMDYISGKAISSRHFEPIGTKTCQILLEGHYNGILKPDEHYISVKKDLSNIHEAIDFFKDESVRKRITENAFQFVMDNHTYNHRVKKLVNAILSE